MSDSLRSSRTYSIVTRIRVGGVISEPQRGANKTLRKGMRKDKDLPAILIDCVVRNRRNKGIKRKSSTWVR